MSTVSGKPQGPIELSAYVSQRARERLAPEQEAPLRSPYAPRVVREAEEAAEATQAPISSGDPLSASSPLAEGEGGGAASGPAAREDMHSTRQEREDRPVHSAADWPAAAASADQSPAASPPASSDPSAGNAPVERFADASPEPDAAALLQPGLPRSDRPGHAMEPPQDRYSDRDLERLEMSLRWLQRQEADVRLPRGPSLAPIPGLSSPEPRGRRYDDMVGRGVRSARSLEPERMAPPPVGLGRRRTLGMTAFALTTVGVAIGSYFLAAAPRLSTPVPQPRLAAADPMYTPTTTRAEPGPTVARDDESEPVVQSKIASRLAERTPERAPERSLPAGESTAAMQPTAPVAPVAAPSPPPPPPAPERPPQRTVDPEEIKLLLKQGEQFIAAGDLITARTVFQRAADLGDATAAMALGATYDPVVLARLGVVGMSAADVTKARTWYQMAEKLGSTEATRRLQILANR